MQHRYSTLFAAVLQDKLDVFCCQFNPSYRRRWRQYILPQFLSNLTRAITHILGGEIRPCNSSIAYPRFEVYKTFLCVFMSNFMVTRRHLFGYGGGERTWREHPILPYPFPATIVALLALALLLGAVPKLQLIMASKQRWRWKMHS